MTEFHKPTRTKPQAEPPGLDAFAAGAQNVRTLEAVRPRGDASAAVGSGPLDDEELVGGMNVRFTAREKALLEKAATAEDRSQHKIIKRLLRPAFAELARLYGEP